MKNLSLTEIKKIIKSNWILVVLAIFSITALSLAILKPFNKTPQVAWKEGITAGKTTRTGVESKIGRPREIKNDNTYLYDSDNKYRPHQIEFSQDTVETVKEQVISDEKGKLQDYVKKYGQPDEVLLGNHGAFAPGHFWEKYGFIVFANQQDGTIVEIWYFSPTDVKSLLNKHADLVTESAIAE